VTQLLDADWLTLGNDRAIPIGTETRIRPSLRTQDRRNGDNAQQRRGEQNAHDVRACGIPLRPFHFSIVHSAAEPAEQAELA